MIHVVIVTVATAVDDRTANEGLCCSILVALVVTPSTALGVGVVCPLLLLKSTTTISRILKRNGPSSLSSPVRSSTIVVLIIAAVVVRSRRQPPYSRTRVLHAHSI